MAAGIAARIRTEDHSSFLLEEHSSRMLNFAPRERLSSVEPITWKIDSKTAHPSVRNHSHLGLMHGKEELSEGSLVISLCGHAERPLASPAFTGSTCSDSDNRSGTVDSVSAGEENSKKSNSKKNPQSQNKSSRRRSRKPGAGQSGHSKNSKATSNGRSGHSTQSSSKSKGRAKSKQSRSTNGRTRVSAMTKLASFLSRFNSKAISDVTSEKSSDTVFTQRPSCMRLEIPTSEHAEKEKLSARLSGPLKKPHSAPPEYGQVRRLDQQKAKPMSPMACFGRPAKTPVEATDDGSADPEEPKGTVVDDDYSAFTALTSGSSILGRRPSLRRVGRSRAPEE